ncbi:MAG TPA: class I SAM-dependent methyltransferase [Ktedonosporobacter sp.]|nr:class I SAM-dependent methyltransferase [Ktedonosporobacter sp.]
MKELNKNEETVARHYDSVAFEYEQQRLAMSASVEFAITVRYLQRYLPASARVVELGVGSGQYTEVLAQKGCWLHLVDVSERLLDSAVARLERAGMASQILDSQRASATHLPHLQTESSDAVLCLGPLYHLCSLADRKLVVREVARILKPGGWLYAAGINRFAYLRDTFRQHPQQGVERWRFCTQLLRDGNTDSEHTPLLGPGHLTTSEEFGDLFRDSFDEEILVGLESFTAGSQEIFSSLSTENADAWLDLVEQTGKTRDGLGISDHFLYIGRKRA